MQDSILLLAAGVIFLWGIGHLIPTRNVVAGFGALSPDNRRTLTMEWIAEGLSLCFLGLVIAAFVLRLGAAHPATVLLARACALMLFVLAGVSAFTGARTSILPMKLCPWIKSLVGLSYLLASFL